jgi:aryl-alcohol dehydrogenase-like predicted oxidoreductase
VSSGLAPEASAVPARVRLGRTDLEVCRIGIGCGAGLSGADLEYAISRGANYVFTSSDLHAVTYRRSWSVIRRLRRSSRCEEIVLVACSYVCDPEKLIGILVDQLLAWRLDHVDVFQWGWVTRTADPHVLLATADAVLRKRTIREVVGPRLEAAGQVGSEMRARGYARHLAISTHDRAIAREAAGDPNLDVLMFRYNLAHRGAEREIFPFLPARPDRPGIVVFNTSHDAAGSLRTPPAALPPGKYLPDQGDLYRFCLDVPDVDVVLTGPRSRREIDEALDTLRRPPQSPPLRRYLEKYGDLHAGKVRVATA